MLWLFASSQHIIHHRKGHHHATPKHQSDHHRLLMTLLFIILHSDTVDLCIGEHLIQHDLQLERVDRLPRTELLLHSHELHDAVG